MSDNEDKVTNLNGSTKTAADKMIDENKREKNKELDKAVKEAATALTVFQNALNKVDSIKDDIDLIDREQRSTLKKLGL